MMRICSSFSYVKLHHILDFLSTIPEAQDLKLVPTPVDHLPAELVSKGQTSTSNGTSLRVLWERLEATCTTLAPPLGSNLRVVNRATLLASEDKYQVAQLDLINLGVGQRVHMLHKGSTVLVHPSRQTLQGNGQKVGLSRLGANIKWKGIAECLEVLGQQQKARVPSGESTSRIHETVDTDPGHAKQKHMQHEEIGSGSAKTAQNTAGELLGQAASRKVVPYTGPAGSSKERRRVSQVRVAAVTPIDTAGASHFTDAHGSYNLKKAMNMASQNTGASNSQEQSEDEDDRHNGRSEAARIKLMGREIIRDVSLIHALFTLPTTAA